MNVSNKNDKINFVEFAKALFIGIVQNVSNWLIQNKKSDLLYKET